MFHSTRKQGEVVCGSFRCGEGVPDPSGEHIRRRGHLVRQGGRLTSVGRCSCQEVEGCDVVVEKAKAKYVGDKYAKSVVQSVQSLLWW